MDLLWWGRLIRGAAGWGGWVGMLGQQAPLLIGWKSPIREKPIVGRGHEVGSRPHHLIRPVYWL